MDTTTRDRVREARRELMNALADAEVDDFAPVSDRVLLLPIREEDRQTNSGLWIPDEEKHWRASVVAVGPGPRSADGTRQPPAFEVGDVVVVGAWVGEPVEHDGVDYRWAKQADVLAILRDDA